MSQYLSLADYLLLALQGVLSVVILFRWRQFPIHSLRAWAGVSLSQVPLWWVMAYRASAEVYGTVFTRMATAEQVLLAVCACEIGAAILPESRRQIWQRGAGAIALALVIGIVLLQSGAIMAPQGFFAVTLIGTGTSLAVLLSCVLISDERGSVYQIGRAFCLYLAGQLVAVQVPTWLGCDTPACLVQPTITAHVARRAGPVLWAVTAGWLIWASHNRGKAENYGSE